MSVEADPPQEEPRVAGTLSVRRASPRDIKLVAALFDDYRRFYDRASDVSSAESYLRARFENEESALFIAQRAEGDIVGFCQLYPAFCSVFMARIFILYDLFVTPHSRKMGGARALLAAAERYAAEQGGIRLELRTAAGNLPARALYESAGWRRNEHFHSYSKWLVELGSGQ